MANGGAGSLIIGNIGSSTATTQRGASSEVLREQSESLRRSRGNNTGRSAPEAKITKPTAKQKAADDARTKEMKKEGWANPNWPYTDETKTKLAPSLPTGGRQSYDKPYGGDGWDDHDSTNNMKPK